MQHSTGAQVSAGCGGDVFRCCVNELGLRVQHLDGSIELVQPPDFAAELEAIKAYIVSFPTHNLLLIEKNGGFAVKHADIDGRPAKGSHVDRVNSFVRDLALRNRELTFVVTDGFIDLCSAQLSKRFGAELQMRREPFLGTWAIGFGDGLTDERLFEIMNLGVKVGNEPSRADERLTSHVHFLDVLQWMVDLRVEANRLL